MVRHLLIVLAALATHVPDAADARPPDEDYEPPPEIETQLADDAPAFNMFGFDMAIGVLPVDGHATVAMSIGLAVEHPVFRKTRVFGEYDWLWLSRRDDPRALEAMAPRPERHASGHRGGLGLRRELVAKSGRTVRFFVDGELGANVTLANDNMDGMQFAPAVFTGLRTGYDLYSRRDESPSRTFETALYLRAIAVRDGVGFTFGVGMYWGN